MKNKVIEPQTDPLQEAVDILGLYMTGTVCGVSGPAVAKWLKQGIPRTEWTGETTYCKAIQKATSGRVKRKALLKYHANRKATA